MSHLFGGEGDELWARKLLSTENLRISSESRREFLVLFEEALAFSDEEAPAG